MIEFKVNGQTLDLPERTTLQLVRKNEIFAFDSIEVERSVSFDIPATPANNSILGIAKDYHGAGNAMRIKIAATMIVGVVTRSGYLCVTQFDYKQDVYKAVFLFGQLIGLQALRTAGNISDLGLQTADYIDGDSPVYDAQTATNEIWAKVRYNANDLHGSISVKMLVDLLNAQETGLPNIVYPQGIDGLRIIKGKQKGFDNVMPLRGVVNPDGGRQPAATEPNNPYNLITDYDPNLFETVSDYFPFYTTLGGGVQQYYNIQGLRVLTPLAITFPREIGNDWFLQKQAYTGGSASNFYGDHWYVHRAANQDPDIYGSPIGGKTVEFAAGDTFYLVNVKDFVWQSIGDTVLNGWRFNANNRTFPYDFAGKVFGESRYFLRDNFPDFSPVELCKIIAAVTGTVLRYDETNGVWFDDLSTGWNTREISDVITRDNMERKFGEYAQRNYVRFEDNDNPSPIVATYTVDNETLQAENDLQVIPLSSGVNGVRNNHLAIGLTGEIDTLAGIIDGVYNDYLQRVDLKKNAEIQRFCDNSTTLRITRLFNILDYVSLTPKTILYYDGCEWAWIETQWNADGKGQMVLVQRGRYAVNITR